MFFKSKKNTLALFLYYTGLIHLLAMHRRERITVINYHRIYSAGRQGAVLFDEGVFGPDIIEFEKQMRWLKSNAVILSELDLIDGLKQRKKFPVNSVMVTFDDGYIDNYTLAYPVLKRLQIPAIFFIPTACIDNRMLGWWDLIAYFIKETKKQSINVNDIDFEIYKEKSTSILQFLNFVYLNKLDPESLVKDLSIACEVSFPSRELQSKQLMDWQQIREVSKNGISIGSHTKSHRILSSLTVNQQESELIESKIKLENELASPVKSISYPVGGMNHFSNTTKTLARKNGYKLGFSFNSGINFQPAEDIFNIKRVSVSNNIPRFQAELIWPEIFYGNSK